MKVTHEEGHITHAVVGGLDAIECGITGDAHFMHMLSASLYKNPTMAMCREVLCNAWDAHIMVSKTDPIKITVDRDELIIQDFGPGIHHDKIGPIYGVYGASTKKNDGRQTGGFGLGCKSPWSYTDTFEVVSCHEGQKAIYQMTKSASERQGKPSIKPIVVGIPTTDTGITVTIRLKNGDSGEIMRYVKQTLYYGGIPAEVNGKLYTVLPYQEATDNWILANQLNGDKYPIMVRYGNVVYPINEQDEYQNEYREVSRFLKSLPRNENGYALIFSAEPDSLTPTPSRDELTMIDMTVETLKKLLTGFVDTLKRDGDTVVKERSVERIKDLFQQKPLAILEWDGESVPPKRAANSFFDNTSYYSSLKKPITDFGDVVDLSIDSRYPGKYIAGFRKLDLSTRWDLWKTMPGLDKRLVESFGRHLAMGYGDKPTQAQLRWFTRNVTGYIVKKAMKQDYELKLENFYFVGGGNRTRSWHKWPTSLDRVMYNVHEAMATQMWAMAPYLKNRIVLTHGKNAIMDRMAQHPQYKDLPYQERTGWLLYVVPRSPKRASEALAFFQGLGMDVIDMMPIHAWEDDEFKPKKREKPLVPVVKKPKKTGYICLSASVKDGVYNPYEYARDNEDAERIEQPLFYVTLKPKGRHGYDMSLNSLSDRESRNAVELYGKYGAIIQLEKAINEATKNGAVVMEEWIPQRVLQEMTTNKRIRQYFAISAKAASKLPDWTSELGSVVNLVANDPVLQSKYGIVNPMTPRDTVLLNLFQSMVGQMHHYYGRFNAVPEVIRTGFRKMEATLDEIKPAPEVVSLVQMAKDNTILSCLSISKIKQILQSISPKDILLHESVRNLFINALEGK
ncbi:putative rIIA lysis inhibitor [Achromobacter phage vB_AxyP_19-32_Axy22]|uniref:Putative rIIA lysis inhibitor n=1 Tax=Achromobacter phage vB_AxyP_19-32_Axy22 TaxID=2591046 RepID=A0A514CVU8_9CAUD|nr:putative rIIA lysis inhibitor [Achromobacter phage vB_AxyP_19-32_Axy22]